jgi:phage terminase large subunit-like protein
MPTVPSSGNRQPTLLRCAAGAVDTRGILIADFAKENGLILDPWQRDILELGCAIRANGKWAAFEVAEIIPRQNGKNGVVEARQLAGLFLFDEVVQTHSAHEFKSTKDHRIRIFSLIQSNPDLDRLVKNYKTGSADMGVELHNKAELRFVARTKGSGRGMSGSTVYFDEAYALRADQMGALVPTLSAQKNPQLWYFSSAPHYTSDFLHALLRRAEDDEEVDLFLAAWENQADVNFDDVEAWKRVNPAWDYRITEDFTRKEKRTLCSTPEGVAEFARERLGIREGGDGEAGIVDYPTWYALRDEKSRIATRRCIGLSVSPDGAVASFAAAGRREDGKVHVETIQREIGTGWVVARAKELHQKWQVTIRVNPAGAESALFKALGEARVPIEEVGGREYAYACGTFLDMVKNGRIHHWDQETMNRAVSAAGRRTMDKELWTWARPGSVDISPLTAATLALSGVEGPTDETYVPRRLR